MATRAPGVGGSRAGLRPARHLHSCCWQCTGVARNQPPSTTKDRKVPSLPPDSSAPPASPKVKELSEDLLYNWAN